MQCEPIEEQGEELISILEIGNSDEDISRLFECGCVQLAFIIAHNFEVDFITRD